MTNTRRVTTVHAGSAVLREGPPITFTSGSPRGRNKPNTKHCAGQRCLQTPERDLTLWLIRRIPKGAILQTGSTVYFLDSESGRFHNLGPCHHLYEKGGVVIAVLTSSLVFSCADGTGIQLCRGIWSISQVDGNLPQRGALRSVPRCDSD
jgi:hypothetical protein